MQRVHLAIVRRPYLGMILEGTKTAEARLSKARRVPYHSLETGETIYLKAPGEPICARAEAGAVHRFELDDPESIAGLRDRFGAQLGGRDIGENYWSAKADARYAVVIELLGVRPDRGPSWYEPSPGRTAWRLLERPDQVPTRSGTEA